MTFGAPIALQTVAWAAVAIGGLAVLAYALKMRRRRYEVPFSLLWQRVLAERESTSLFRHLRRWLSLLLWLFILGLLLFAVTDPELGEPDDDAQSVVIIVDASASMMTRDAGSSGEKPRIEAAKDEARHVLSSLGGADAAMVIRMADSATPLTRFETDHPALRRAVDGIRAVATPADLRGALETAADALRDRERPMIILIGDGNYGDDALDAVRWDDAEDELRLSEIDLSGIDVRYLPVGEATQNAGIVALGVRRYITNRLAYEAILEVQNFGDEPARRDVVLYDGDVPIEVQHVELAPGERRRTIYSELGGGSGGTLRAVLRPPDDEGDGESGHADAFHLDDEAHALLPARSRQRALLVTRDNLYLEGAILVYDEILVDKLTPDDYEAELGAQTLPEYDLVIFDDTTPEELPGEGTNLIYFNPQGEHSPFAVERTLRAPRITDTAEHPVTRWLVLGDVNFDEASVFRVDRSAGEVPLFSSVRAPIAAAKREGERRILAFGFSLGGTDLMLRVAFPLLLVNALDWFAGDDSDLIATYSTGDRVRVALDATYEATAAEVRTPSGHRRAAPVADGYVSIVPEEVGVYEITARRGDEPVANLSVAANLANPRESNIAPVETLELGGRALEAPEGFEPSMRRSLWRYLALLTLVLLVAEWLTYHRRITV